MAQTINLDQPSTFLIRGAVVIDGDLIEQSTVLGWKIAFHASRDLDTFIPEACMVAIMRRRRLVAIR
jgi:hypothetical protein